jgi:elongin-A
VPKHPLELGAWYAKYKELLEENKREVDEDAVAMRAVLDSIATERAKHTSKLVDHIPQNNRKRKAGDNGSFAIVPGQRKKVMTGKGVMDKIRQETKVSSIFSTRKSNVAMTTPTHQLQNRASQIRALPKGLIEEHRRAPAPNYKEPSQNKPTTIIAPRKRASLSSPIKSASPMGSEYRMKRPLDVEPSSSDSTSLDSRSVVSTSTAKSSPPPPTALSSPLLKPMSYAVPRQRTASPFTNGCRPVAKLKKPPVDPMMPAKRRKIA